MRIRIALLFLLLVLTVRGFMSRTTGQQTFDVVFHSKGVAASISINGTSLFTDQQIGSFQAGIYSADSRPLIQSVITFNFANWTATGGVAIQDTTSNPTTVTITGPGTLTASYSNPNNTGSENPTNAVPIAPNLILLAALTSTALAAVINRRRNVTE